MVQVARSPSSSTLSRVGAYLLPGRTTDPLRAVAEARTAEHLGLGSAWIGERLGTKDFGPLLGAVAQATSSIRLGSAVTNIGLRHPLLLASAAMSLQAMTQGRFILGLGRLHPSAARAYGLQTPNNQVVRDTAGIVRRLCQGETVSYDGPAGNFPKMRLTDLPELPAPPLVLAAIGPKSLDIAGQYYDGVVLHPFLTAAAVGRCALRVRTAAAAAGRDPQSVRVYATVVVAADLTDQEETAVAAARAVTYFQIPGYGENLVDINGWSREPLAQLRADPVLAGLPGAADHRFTRHELLDTARRCVPTEWTMTGAAIGTASHCSSRLREYLAEGADELILHGSTTELLGPVAQHLAAAEQS